MSTLGVDTSCLNQGGTSEVVMTPVQELRLWGFWYHQLNDGSFPCQ